MSTALVTGQENIQLAVVSGASTNIEVNDLALISDCEKATLFKVTSVAVNGAAMTLGHAVSAANGNIVAGLQRREPLVPTRQSPASFLKPTL